MHLSDDLVGKERESRSDQTPTNAGIDRIIDALLDAQNQESEKNASKPANIAAATTDLIAALRGERWEVRSDAILALEKVGKPASTVIQTALVDPDWFVRATAANALSHIKDPKSVEGLISILDDGEWFVRERAAEALSKIGEPAVEALIGALKDRNGLVRERAAELLGKIGSVKSLMPLREAFNDNELYVRARAVLAFERVKATSAKNNGHLDIDKQHSAEFNI